MGSADVVAQIHGTLRCVGLLELNVLGFVLVPAHRAIATTSETALRFRFGFGFGFGERK